MYPIGPNSTYHNPINFYQIIDIPRNSNTLKALMTKPNFHHSIVKIYLVLKNIGVLPILTRTALKSIAVNMKVSDL